MVVLQNRYQPVKLLGSGGFAKTYLAVDTQKLNESCVIKQLAPLPENQRGETFKKATELFLQEAKQLQKLGEHPQIPDLLAYIQEKRQLYLVQQFIDGENLLEELATQGIFSEDKIRLLLEDLLPVISYVHKQGTIHRDIKPENIMRRRGDGRLILIDFGASKQLQRTPRRGTVIGTNGFQPREQTADGIVYPASDLYSLGATCFYLLTKVNPAQLWEEDGYNWVRTWRKHLGQSVSKELESVLNKLLAVNYQDRYQSAEAVLEDLNYFPPTDIKQIISPPIPIPWGFGKLTGIVGVIILIILTIPYFFWNPFKYSKYEKYENFNYGFNIKHPQIWKREDLENPITGEVVAFVSPETGNSRLTIIVDTFDGTLEDLTTSNSQIIQQNFPKVQIIEQGTTTISNKPASQIVFTSKDGDTLLKHMQVSTLEGDRAYIVNYTAEIDKYNRFLPIVQDMVQSLKVFKDT